MKQCDVPNCNRKGVMGWQSEYQMRKPETIIKGETKMAKTKKKAKVEAKAKAKVEVKTKQKLVGKTSGVGILQTWSKMFEQNEKEKLSDKQILQKMKAEFPDQSAKSKIFNSVSAHRSFYNRGILTKSKPEVRSKQFKN